MPKRAAGLTARQVETSKKPGMFADGGGLYLQVVASGARTWIFRFRPRGGRRRDRGLGSADRYGLSLADAREKVRAVRKLVGEGIDPIEQRRAERQAKALEAAKVMTFRQCAAGY